MEQVHFFVDESGAKGYAERIETKPGELGVMAGFPVPDDIVGRVRSELDAITSRYLVNGKLHITDLEPGQQEELRQSIFSYFALWKIPWVYEAIYVQGFHENAEVLKAIGAKVKASANPRFRVTSHPPSESLHSELFFCTFAKGLSVAMDFVGNAIDFQVRMDNVDQTILKSFEEEARRFLDCGKPKLREVKGYDLEQKKPLVGQISTETTSGQEMLGDFSGVTFSIKTENSSLTLAADVLANSVHHHLMMLQERSPGAPLNTKEAIAGHPLSALVRDEWEVPGLQSLSDAIYQHPEARGMDDDKDEDKHEDKDDDKDH